MDRWVYQKTEEYERKKKAWEEKQAANKVKKQLQDKRKEEALEKADTVRASGHGLDSRAAITSREQHQEDGAAEERRERVLRVRHPGEQAVVVLELLPLPVFRVFVDPGVLRGGIAFTHDRRTRSSRRPTRKSWADKKFRSSTQEELGPHGKVAQAV